MSEVKLIYTATERYYATPAGKLPSVNQILQATKPAEEKQRLAIWKKKALDKAVNTIKSCEVCQSFNGRECTAGQRLRLGVVGAAKNRCKYFSLPQDKLDQMAEESRQKALSRGTKVHELIEVYLRGGDHSMDDPHYKQIWYFLQTIRPDVLWVECPLWMPGAAGTADCIIADRICDWTTTKSDRPKREWYEDKLIQCAAYATMCRHMGLCEPESLVVKVMTAGGRALDVQGDYADYAPKWQARLDAYHLLK